MGDWESIFKEQGKYFFEPDERLVESVDLLKREKIKKILDLGCGTGRHTIFLSEKGFDVTGMDISATGIRITREGIKEKNLKAKLKKSSCYSRFPFKNKAFDAVISTQVIQHNYHSKILVCISEIERILMPGGILFLTVPYKKNQRHTKKSEKVDEHTYIPLEGEEKGLPHFLYTKKILRDDFKRFRLISLTKEKGHYCFIGKLKA